MPEKTTIAKSTKALNIYQKLALIGENVKVLKKDKSGYGYTYVAEEDILARIQGAMQEYAVSLIPNILPGTVEFIPRDTSKLVVPKGGGTPYKQEVYEQVVQGTITYTWVNNDNPEDRLEVPWYFIGQQGDASQAYGSALTYASRYFLLRFFNIATTNDPDALIAKKKAEEAKKAKEVFDDIVSQIRTIIESAIAADEKNKAKVAEVVEAQIGNKDYRKAKNAIEAALLLEELKKTFTKEETK